MASPACRRCNLNPAAYCLHAQTFEPVRAGLPYQFVYCASCAPVASAERQQMERDGTAPRPRFVLRPNRRRAQRRLASEG